MLNIEAGDLDQPKACKAAGDITFCIVNPNLVGDADTVYMSVL